MEGLATKEDMKAALQAFERRIVRIVFVEMVIGLAVLFVVMRWA